MAGEKDRYTFTMFVEDNEVLAAVAEYMDMVGTTQVSKASRSDALHEVIDYYRRSHPLELRKKPGAKLNIA